MSEPTPSQHLSARLKALDLNLDDRHWFLGGSSALALRDIRRVSDIDVGVTTGYWTHLREQRGYSAWTPDDTDPTSRCDPPYLVTEVLGTPVHFFFAWRLRNADDSRFNDFNLVFREGMEYVQGWPVIKLPILLRQKVDAAMTEVPVRPKDLTDIRHIVDYMEREAA